MNLRLTRLALFLFVAGLLAGCGGEKVSDDKTFFTSGSREADQRAEQRIVKDKQLRGEGEGKGGPLAGLVKPTTKPTLYERLGGEKGVAAIVDDFVTRALADPRVNFERKGIESGGLLGVHQRNMYWNPDANNVAGLKKHLAQFVTLATGGPTTYEGKEMREAHYGMKITNAEFDAAVGDLKATLDKVATATDEQKELLAIVESTRPQVVEAR